MQQSLWAIAPRHTSLLLSAALSVSVALPTGVRADEAQPAAATTGAEAPSSKVAVEPTPAMPLSLSEAIDLGLQNNLDVEIERHAPLIAEQSYLSSWGAYDPVASGEFGHTQGFSPTGNPLLTSNLTKTTDGSARLSGLLPYFGTQYSIDYVGDRNDGDSFIQTYNPQFTSGLAFSGTMPLLKGLIWNEAWTGVRSSRTAYESSIEVFRATVMDTVQQIETAYWDLVAVREQLRVARKSQQTATALLQQVETQYEVGVVSKVDVIEAEAGVAERDVTLIREENSYRTAQDRLIDAVLGPHLTAASTLEIDPTEPPQSYTAFDVNVEAAVNRAFANRPELRSAEKGVEQTEIELRFRKNARLPQLDFQASYRLDTLSGRNGAAPSFGGGAPTPIADPAAGSTYRDSADALFSNQDGERWTVRGVVSIPLGNISGRHNVTKAEFELRRANAKLRRMEQRVILEVREGARNLLSADRGIEAAERRSAAATEQLRAERVRLEHGESTPFDVLQRERDLVDAESQKIAALQLYRASEAALLRAQGTILGARQIRIEDTAPLRSATERW